MAEPPEVHILFLGDDGVGKSTFLSRISQGSNAPKNASLPVLREIDQPYPFDITMYNRPYRLEISTSKSPTHWTLLDPNLIVLCFDIDQRLSLIHIQRIWHKAVHTSFASKTATTPILLLGLKRDLRSETNPNGIIYPQEAYRIAQEMRCDAYLECSARTGELVREVWEDICRIAAKGTVGGEDGGGLSSGGCGVM